MRLRDPYHRPMVDSTAVAGSNICHVYFLTVKVYIEQYSELSFFPSLFPISSAFRSCKTTLTVTFSYLLGV